MMKIFTVSIFAFVFYDPKLKLITFCFIHVLVINLLIFNYKRNGVRFALELDYSKVKIIISLRTK